MRRFGNRRRRGRLITAYGVVLAATMLLGVSGIARANQLVTITIPDRHGEIPSKWLSYRGLPRANVLLPNHYNPRRRYPLMVVLNGLNCDYAWYVQSGVSAVFSGLNAIVVMPEGGNGWYTDWWNDGERGGPAWESYIPNEVLPYVLRHYKILPQRRCHAIVGHSMGGRGAAYLGGRLPGFFGSIASLSGFVDPQLMAQVTQPAMGLTAEAPLKGDYNSDPVDGPPRGFYADAHNPTLLAMNLEQTRVSVSTGTGVPSRAGLANPTKGGPQALLEGAAAEGLIIYPMNQLYHRALSAARVDVTYQVHAGGHDLPDTINEFKAMLAWGLFKPVVSRPAAWVNDTAATSGQLWDIRYRFAQPPNQVVQFRRAGNRLRISRAGSAVSITTSTKCVIRTVIPAVINLRNDSCTHASAQ